MASWAEINDYRRNGDRMRALAKRLIARGPEILTEWEIVFLWSIQGQGGDGHQFTSAQAEKLLQIRDDGEFVETVRDGLSVRLLLKQCFDARLDLSPEDEDWIERRFVGDPARVLKRETWRLLRLAVQLYLIEPDDEPAVRDADDYEARA